MHVVHHATGRALLDAAAGALEAREAENGLLLGICGRLGDRGDVNGQPAVLLTLHDASGPVAAAVRTPPLNLVITRLPEGGAEALRDALFRAGAQAPGVTGPREDAERFAAAWCDGRALRAEVRMRQGLYELRRVIPPPPAPGAMRPGVPADEETLLRWAAGFVADAGLPPEEQPMVEAAMREGIPSGALFVWDDGGPVSVARATGRTRRGVRVGFVYTPPERRRRGYAASCVAAVSRRMLDDGCAFCTLYTDLANPTSNGVYQRIGYEGIGECAVIRFAAA